MTSSPQLPLTIRIISSKQTVLLRHSVLWPDLPVSDVLLEDDDSGNHYGAFLDGVSDPVAVISVFVSALPQPAPDEEAGSMPVVRFRKFACDPQYQRKGIGTRLLQHVFNNALSRSQVPVVVVWCDARVSAAEWYERKEIGMHRFGETFFKGDIEYVRMKRVLTAGPGQE